MSKEVVEAITELALLILQREQFELVDVEYAKEKNQWFLRVFIDKTGGIDIEDTALVSEELSQKMDERHPNPFGDVDFLEVSSPGAERALKKEADFEAALGQYIHVSLYQAVEKVKQLEGELLQVNEQELRLRVQEKTRVKEIALERKNIAKARLAVKV